GARRGAAGATAAASPCARGPGIGPGLACNGARCPTPRRLDPGLVARGSVDRRHLGAGHANVDRELSAVMHLVHERGPEDVHGAEVTHLAGADRELDGLAQILLARLRHPGEGLAAGRLERADHLLELRGRLRARTREIDLALERHSRQALLAHERP